MQMGADAEDSIYSCPANLSSTLLFSYGKSPLPVLLYPPQWLIYPIAPPPRSSFASAAVSMLKGTGLLFFLAIWLFVHGRARGKTHTAPKIGSASRSSVASGPSSRAVTTLRKQHVSLRSAPTPSAPAPPPPPGANQMKLSSLSVGSMKSLGKQSHTAAPRRGRPPRRGPGFYRRGRGMPPPARMMIPPPTLNMNARSRGIFRGGRGGGMFGRKSSRIGKYIVGQFKDAIGKASVEPVKFSVGSTSSEHVTDEDTLQKDIGKGKEKLVVSSIDEVIEELEVETNTPTDGDMDAGGSMESTERATTPTPDESSLDKRDKTAVICEDTASKIET